MNKSCYYNYLNNSEGLLKSSWAKKKKKVHGLNGLNRLLDLSHCLGVKISLLVCWLNSQGGNEGTGSPSEVCATPGNLFERQICGLCPQTTGAEILGVGLSHFTNPSSDSGAG